MKKSSRGVTRSLYNYGLQRANLFTDEGQRLFLLIRDKVHTLIAQSGAVRMQEIISSVSGDTWDMMACVDRLVELGEIREVTQPNSCPAQHCVYVSAKSE